MEENDKYCIGRYVEKILNMEFPGESEQKYIYYFGVRMTWAMLCQEYSIKYLPYKEEVISILEKRLGKSSRVEANPSVTKITTPNSEWYFAQMKDGYRIIPVTDHKVPIHHVGEQQWLNIDITPEVIADIMIEFEKFLPVIEYNASQKYLELQNEKMSHTMMITAAKGIFESLRRDNKIKIDCDPEIEHYYGEFVILSFWGAKTERFSCSLKFLEKELLERFGNQ